MAEKKEKLDQMLCVPLSKSMKAALKRIAEAEERTPSDMARMLWREAIEARKQKTLAAAS